MKNYTKQQIIEAGWQAEVFETCGTLYKMWVSPAFNEDEIANNYELAPDEVIHDFNIRATIPELLPSLSFVARPPDRKSVKPCYYDAIGVDALWTGGFDTLVSEKACEKLAPYLGDECIFVPTQLEGAPQPYYIMWVTQIYDAIDLGKTSILPKHPLYPKKIDIHKAAFNLEKIESKYLFRLPRWKYVYFTSDLSLEPFRELVKKFKITGFEFRAPKHGMLLRY